MGEEPDPLVSAAAAADAFLRSRIADPELVADLTQETAVRVARARGRLDDGVLDAYAVTTARNLLVDQQRRARRDERLAERLVAVDTSLAPDELALLAEEMAALATALERLEPDQRELLMAHEGHGTPVGELSQQVRTRQGAVAMRLARARALLRVEFLLAYRRIELPDRCRRILVAISAGDRRRQRALAAAEHLYRCPACAALAPPLVQRDRRAIGWALVPAGTLAATRLAQRFLSRGSGQVAAAATTLAVAGAIVAVTVAGHDSPGTEAAPAPDTATTTTVPATTAPPTTAPPTTAPPRTAPPTTGPATTQTPTPATVPPFSVDGATVPAPGPDLWPYAGRTANATSLPVLAVPADEGFWMGTPDAPIWVQLAVEGESPEHVEPGQSVTLVGTLRLLTPADGLLGLTDGDGDALAANGIYLLVDARDLVLG